MRPVLTWLAAEARHITLKALFDTPVLAVSADLSLIERVLTNLIDNALRHTPVEGIVQIALERQVQRVESTVSDSGPGIPPEVREGLCQRPFSVSGARRGGGLGLRIVHRIPQLHGGEIQLLDLPGQGATFRFALPLAATVNHRAR